MRFGTFLALLTAFLLPSVGLQAQTSEASTSDANPDVLLLTDGEKIIGQMETATDTEVKFKSGILGELTIEWTNIKELHSSHSFAAIPKGVKLRNKANTDGVQRGQLSVADQKVTITPASSEKPSAAAVPVTDYSDIVSQSEYDNAFTHRNFLRGWKGGISAGVSVTDATQTSRNFSGTLGLVRGVPDVSWLSPRSRTLFNLNEAYGTLEQAHEPQVKTSLFHTDLEEDFYLSPRVFFFSTGALDHNFSQGLQLQQSYGIGFGAALIKDKLQEFDVRASVNYIDQRFINQQLIGEPTIMPSGDQHLVGSVFGQTYTRKLPWKVLLNEAASVTPAWNNTNAYSAIGTINLTFPVYHRFGLVIGALDNYLNDPSQGFKKNSLQTTLGATYTLK